MTPKSEWAFRTPAADSLAPVVDASRRPGRWRRPPPPPWASAWAGPDPADADGDRRYLNRELSTLDFNGRVLALAENPDLPLLERIKFLAIFGANTDEFFQVRVAGLKDQQAAGISGTAPDGLSVTDQLHGHPGPGGGAVPAPAGDLPRRHPPAPGRARDPAVGLGVA